MAWWGTLLYRFRWLVLALAILSIVPAGVLISRGGRLETGYIPTETEAGRTAALLARELPGAPPSFNLIFSSATLSATAPAFEAAVERALAPLRQDPRVRAIRRGGDVARDAPSVSRDGHRRLVTVELAGEPAPVGSHRFSALATDVYPALRAAVRSPTLDVVAAGELPFVDDLTRAADTDLRRIEAIVLPLVLLLLVLVFGSLVAAALPLAVGLLAVANGVGATFLLSRVTPVSVYATNVVSMIGLGVAIDYALFIVTRFREEIRTRAVPDAVARAVATAGQAALYSGITVMIGLLGMLLLGLGDLGTIGIGGAVVVVLAVVYALTLLPALLAVLGPRVNRLRVPFLHPERAGAGRGLWHALATAVMRRPWRVLIPVTALLLLLGSPVLALRLASTGVTGLPPSAEARRGEELLRTAFPGEAPNLITVAVRYAAGAPLEPARIGELVDFGQWLGRRPTVRRVTSAVTVDPRLGRADYERMLARPIAALPPALQALVHQTVGPHVVTFAVYSASLPSSDEARTLVGDIRRRHPPLGGDVSVTGETAFDVDLARTIARHAPGAIAFILGTTYFVLLVLLRSLLLPLKATIMNLLSITASYGALVALFQWGYLSGWLGVTPGPIEVVTPIIMFCVLFGLSMDYEVLLLTRAREEYEQTGDNTHAVALSLERTGRLITGAALIMAAVFLGFGAASLVVIKAIGVGMGLAVLVDATIVRALLVPATMRLLGRWNWWLPFVATARGGRHAQ